jgi:signal peptidase I
VIVNKLAYGLRVPVSAIRVLTWNQPARGEIVTFFSPETEELLIKRVIGIPGDRIALINNQLQINGRMADYAMLADDQLPALNAYERHRHRFYLETIEASVRSVMLRPAPPNAHNNFDPITVPDGQYLMLGDNRDNSKDSRYIGLIAADRITGRAHTVAFSVDYEDFYLPRGDRFFQSLARVD